MNTNGSNCALSRLLEWRVRYAVCTRSSYIVTTNAQVEDIIESKARNLDMTTAHSYYELLYSYYVAHSNYRKGVSYYFFVVAMTTLLP